MSDYIQDRDQAKAVAADVRLSLHGVVLQLIRLSAFCCPGPGLGSESDRRDAMMLLDKAAELRAHERVMIFPAAIMRDDGGRDG